jgi:sn-glycerol 3-phosphate transport system permease protein
MATETIEAIEVPGADVITSAGRETYAGKGGPWRVVRITLRYLLMTVLAVIVLFPIYITVVNSLLTPEQIAARPPTFFPTDPQWDTYKTAFTDGNMDRYLVNSFIVASLITVGQIVTSVMAAYAFTFLRFPFRTVLFIAFIATLMVPFEALILINRATMVRLDWINSYQALVVPFLATGFGAFLLRQAFLQVPKDLKDAAELDGYGHWKFMTRVVVPLTRPAIAALGVFSFLQAWNQYLWPLLVTDDERYRTVQIGLKQLTTTSVEGLNITVAGTIIAVLPIFVLLLIFQKYIIRGLTAGAVKG